MTRSAYSEQHAALSHEAWITVTIGGRLASPNRSLERLLGWTPAMLTDGSLAEIVLAGEVGEVGEALLEAFADHDRVISRVNRFVHKDGTIRWIGWSAQATSNNSAVMVLREASPGEEAALIYRETARHHRRLEDLASDPVLRYSLGGRLVGANTSARALLGLADNAPIPDQALNELFDPGESERIFRQVLPTLRRAGVAYAQMLVRAPNGRFNADVALQLDMVPPASYICWCRDTSNRGPAAALNRDLAAVVSHELRTPLATSMAALDLLRAPDLGWDRLQERLVDMMGRSLDQLKRLTDDILDLESILAGRRETPFVPLRANQIAGDAVAMLAPLFEKEGRVVDVEESPADPYVYGERSSLIRALINLIDNALHHSPNGSPVTVLVDTEPEGATFFGVRDHGPGIPEHDRERIFERFVRLPTGSAYRGSGLGLPIVNAIVHQHSGRLLITDTAGGGATFFLFLPGIYPSVEL